MANTLRIIGNIGRALDSIANVEFKKFDLAKGQYLYLVRILENPGIIQERLAEMIAVDRTTSNRAIQKLVKNGLVTKVDDLNNQKIKHLYITAAGETFAQVILRENDYSTAVALTGFSTEEIATLNSLLERMDANVYADWRAVKKGQVRKY
ncbi:MarR family transcriptional regulator [Weissella oryzae SG25]|uniref:MarR family transcriptional regulator n=1 Tax=Weissella oryzae (strain DSM 25784 / JCM 18191 / LMG 30913 / SG25) TaxID=1329250 RepID=A0A069CST6_WEIOS|nr:MarR family transcriptional regulator [Weissella oryzae]GAK30870.1 MarR family transcriptional regulator [Weissella oryzae SG25]